MRYKRHKGFTLIEIIFTIVIMAGIFMVIPKILMISSKNESFAMRQDAYLNAISLSKIASSLAWDENNVDDLSELVTTNDNIPCDSTKHIRVGSFLSENGRICHDSLTASIVGSEEGSDDYLLYDDIDDFNGTEIYVTQNGINRYKINTDVSYLKNISYTVNTNTMTIDLNTSSPTSTTGNIKKLTTTIKDHGKKALYHDRVIATFSYYSANIGQFSLSKREW